ncbi:MAG: hypothetical protein K6D03_05955, partial [Solobacterium sp.]|nr:hypothetical protein [Solobacterium sp.]
MAETESEMKMIQRGCDRCRVPGTGQYGEHPLFVGNIAVSVENCNAWSVKLNQLLIDEEQYSDAGGIYMKQKKIMNRILSLAAAFSMLFSNVSTVYAEETGNVTEETEVTE